MKPPRKHWKLEIKLEAHTPGEFTQMLDHFSNQLEEGPAGTRQLIGSDGFLIVSENCEGLPAGEYEDAAKAFCLERRKNG